MFIRIIVLITTTLSVLYQTASANSSPPNRSFRVENSINMVRIIDPAVALSTFNPPNVKMSPDNKYFVVVTRRGDLSSSKSNYTIILYNTDLILAYLSEHPTQQNGLPPGRVLLSVSSSLNEPAFQKITWLENSRAIAFIGWFDSEGEQSPGQVYTLNIRSSSPKKLTNHKRPITSFALNKASKEIIFASTLSRHNKSQGRSSYVVGVMNVNHILNPSWEYPEPDIQYYVQKLNHPNEEQPVGRSYRGFFPTEISLSPDGRKAIVLATIQSPPAHWLAGYDDYSRGIRKRALVDFDENTMMPREDLTTQLHIVDLPSATSKPLLDAPSGLWDFGMSVDVEWLSDSSSVILGNTRLPLDVVDSNEKHRRSLTSSTVEYDLISGSIININSHYRRSEEINGRDVSDGYFYGIFLEKDNFLRIRQKRVNGKYEDLPDKFFEKVDAEWIRVTDPATIEVLKLDSHLEISIHQSLNSAPEIMVRDVATGREKIITNFNPQFKKLTFGETKIVEWLGQNDRKWQGGLIYPPDYNSGQKYPLVIQTHGFIPQEFLIDGPYGTASGFAAQALANRGIVVLQMGEPHVGQGRAQLLAYQDGFESAIDYLSDFGLIDRKKVGLIGWSSTGVDVQHTLLYSDYSIEAATIVDSYNLGMLGYINQFGARAPGMAHIEHMLGDVVPWGKSLSVWVRNNPTLNLDRVNAPIRYEQYERVLSSWWGIYALLKRQQKPVEFYIFNDAAHQLMKPEHRFSSQQGNVDWFDFWLNGRERTEPYAGTPETKESLAEQYQRWRKLRVQQEQSIIEADKARKWHKKEQALREKYQRWLAQQPASVSDNDAVEKKAAVPN